MTSIIFSKNWPKVFLISTITCVLVLVSWTLGEFVGDIMLQSKSRKTLLVKTRQFKEQLEPGTIIELNSSLPNYTFTLLNGDFAKLSDVAGPKTLVVFFHTDCESCMEFMEILGRFHPQNEHVVKMILISASNPLVLRKIAPELPREAVVLYDHEWIYINNLGISSFPYVALLDSELRVINVIDNYMSEPELQQFCGAR